METALRPYAIHRDEGEKLSFFGALTWIKATGAQTGGAFGLIEQLMPPVSRDPLASAPQRGRVLLRDRGRGPVHHRR